MTIGPSTLDAPSPPNSNISSATPTPAKKPRAPAKPQAKKAKKEVTAPSTPVTPNGYAPADASSYGQYSMDSRTAQRAINYDFDFPDTIKGGPDGETL